jgi:hypothetical protein
MEASTIAANDSWSPVLAVPLRMLGILRGGACPDVSSIGRVIWIADPRIPRGISSVAKPSSLVEHFCSDSRCPEMEECKN